MYTIQQILSLSISISKIAQAHNDLINFSNSSVKKEFEIWSDRLLNSTTKEALLDSMDEIVFILNRLPNFEYMLLSRQFDENYPGVSFNFFTEGIQKCNNDDYKFFINRLCKFRDSSLLLNIYNPSRVKLVEEFLKYIRPFTPTEIFKVNDDEIIFILKEMMEDWQEGKPAIFFEDKVKSVAPELNGKKIYLRRSLK